MSLWSVIQPELILIIVACALFVFGVVDRVAARRACAWIALATLVLLFGWLVWQQLIEDQPEVLSDAYGAFRIYSFATFIKLLSSGVAILFVLMAWPGNSQATGNSALNFGTEAGEFFALMLLSVSGIFIVAGANDIVLLFLGVELASIPTYIMVSVSRPAPVAQEAGVKYFFLGAMSAALMLFGFSYLYGTTGLTNLRSITALFNTADGNLTSWQLLAIVMLLAGFAFKMAAVPLHFYAGDVYQGAATPVTAFLSYVPKTSGLVALIKVLFAIGGGAWVVPSQIAKLIWIIAVLTMTFGNVLGLLQQNVKRMLAYSSVAHSGYMLVGVATLLATRDDRVHQYALAAVLFYLASYGIMNAAAFGVLMLLPAKPRPAWDRSARGSISDSAETLDDLAGAGIRHLGLGLAMAVACFSLIGLPLTVGFFGKFYLIQSAWRGGLFWLIVIMMINAAISAGYYLRIVATMFLRPEAATGFEEEQAAGSLERLGSRPVSVAVALSCVLTLALGTLFPATELLNTRAMAAATIDPERSTEGSAGPIKSQGESAKIAASRLDR